MIEFAPNLSGNVSLSVMDDTAAGSSALLIATPITIRGNANGITIARDSAAVEMRLFRVTAAGDLTLETISLTGGIVRGMDATLPDQEGGSSRGGAVLNEGKLQIAASTIYANQAIGGNGGVLGRGGAGLGGAVYNDVGILSISSSTFSGNAVISGSGSTTPSSFGGAIYSKNGSLSVHNVTITNSTASTGRGIYMLAQEGTASADIQSTIIGQSDLTAQAREFLTALDTNGQFIITGANNLIRSQGDFQSITYSTDDPLLGPLAANGGPTLTHAVGADSPTIDHGNNAQSFAHDQRGAGYSRVVGVAADIGAYELQTDVAPSLLGDYNGNHIVDAADYVLWRKTLNTSVPQYSGADGSGDGTIDEADFGVWREHFGATSPPGAAASSSLSASVIGSDLGVTQNSPRFASEAMAIAAAPDAVFIDSVLAAGVSVTVNNRRGARPNRGANFASTSRGNLALAELSPATHRSRARGDASFVPPNSSGLEVEPPIDCDALVAESVWAEWPNTLERGA